MVKYNIIWYNQFEVIIMEKVKTSISLDKNVYDKVKAISDKEDRSFSQQVNNILKEFLKLEKDK